MVNQLPIFFRKMHGAGILGLNPFRAVRMPLYVLDFAAIFFAYTASGFGFDGVADFKPYGFLRFAFLGFRQCLLYVRRLKAWAVRIINDQILQAYFLVGCQAVDKVSVFFCSNFAFALGSFMAGNLCFRCYRI
ncbi:MAG: hypothetical protein KJP07_08925 [Desulfatitalea sp.]|nr:hypothetical protein [Desulfatitalea sp.]